MKIKADMHNHFSTLENIGENIFDRAMDVAQKNLDAGGLFGVINAQDKGIGRYETFLKQGGKNAEDLGNAFYVPNKNIYVIKGQEVFSEKGHILVLGLNKGVRLQDYRTLEDSFKEAKDNNGIIVLDHPCFLDGVITENPENYLEYFKNNNVDGTEVHNGEAWLPVRGCIFKNANKKIQELFYNQIINKFDIGAISTSDGHSVREIGMNYTLLEQPDFSNPEKLIESLRKSIREHKDFSQDKQTNAYLDALNHSVKVAGLRIASKLGLIGRIN
ncbi:MAG: PHP-associated domain-containing protein [Nanoarchaeota archaeon]